MLAESTPTLPCCHSCVWSPVNFQIVALALLSYRMSTRNTPTSMPKIRYQKLKHRLSVGSNIMLENAALKI